MIVFIVNQKYIWSSESDNNDKSLIKVPWKQFYLANYKLYIKLL